MFGCSCTNIQSQNEEDFREIQFKKSIKILLLGTGESGKTTILKQMQILHINGFSEQEKQQRIPFIKQNIQESIYDILDNMNKIMPPVELQLEKNNESKKFILNLGLQDSTYSSHYDDEYYEHVAKLWNDAGVQECFRRANEFQLIDSAKYFLDRVNQIRKTDYQPSIQDILFCRIKTVTITELAFTVPISKAYGGSVDFLVYDVGGQRGEQRKWIQVFDGVQGILFLIASSDFDQNLREDSTKNRLEEAFAVFENICFTRFLRDAGLIVFLNKQDVLKNKIEMGRNIENYFPEYKNFSSNSSSYYDKARMFMANKIEDISKKEKLVDIFNEIKGTISKEKLAPRDVYIHYTIATDTENIKKVLNSVHEMIIQSTLKQTIAF